jgi:hypothetical protein
MVLHALNVHPQGLSFAEHRKVYVRRTVHKESWKVIAPQIRNLKGGVPCWMACREAFGRLTSKARKFGKGYANCGSSPIITKALEKWLVHRLLALRSKTVCTSAVLQRELAREKKIKVEASTIRRHLGACGYHWLTRGKKRKYTPEQRAERWAFAKKIIGMTDAELKKFYQISMDGVVVTIPPKDEVARTNFVRSDDARVYRKPSEHGLPELAGHDPYNKQVPKHRMLPLWGGIGVGGFAVVLLHDDRKVNQEEWAEMVDNGDFVKALQSVSPGKTAGPWKVLCDNESFLRAPVSSAAHRRCKISLVKIPAKSPDLNPVEKYWAWLRKTLRAMYLADLVKKRPVLVRSDYKKRLLRLTKSAKGKQVAANCFRSMRKVALEVDKNEGAASSG